jgi:hypothetical protein
MKKIFIFICFTISVVHTEILLAQIPAKDTIVPAKGDIKGQLKTIKKEKIAEHSDSASDQPKKSPLIARAPNETKIETLAWQTVTEREDC